MPEKIKVEWTIADINKVISPLTSLRSFSKLSFSVTKFIQRNILTLEEVRKTIMEEAEVLEKKLNEEVVFVQGVPSDRTKFKEYQEEIDKINKEKHSLELYVFSSKDFPSETSDFGEREVILNNGTTTKILYLDEYLKLLDVLIIEQDDFENFVVKNRQSRAKQDVKSE